MWDDKRASTHATWASGLSANQNNRPQPHRRSSSFHHPNSSTPSPRPPSSSDGIPDPPTSFPELQGMNLKDLQLLRDEKAKFDDFIEKHAHRKIVEDVVVRIRAEVEQFEKEHEAVTAKMEQAVDDSRLEELRKEISELETEVGGLQKLKEEWMENNSPEKLIERLRIAIAESESTSQMLEKSMLSSSMNFDEFLTQYVACRRKYHERTLKLEQLKLEARKRSISR